MVDPKLIRGDLGETPPGFGESEGASKKQDSEPTGQRANGPTGQVTAPDICDDAGLPEVTHPRRLETVGYPRN
jgi:hypothetical protein